MLKDMKIYTKPDNIKKPNLHNQPTLNEVLNATPDKVCVYTVHIHCVLL